MEIPEGWPTDEMIETGLNEYTVYLDSAQGPLNMGDSFACAFKAALEVAPTPPDHIVDANKMVSAQEDEPVAWMVPRIVTYSLDFDKVVGWEASVFCDSQKQAMIDGKGNVYYPYPLYTRPQSDKLREAAKEYIGYIGHYARTSEESKLLQNLRAALEGK